MAIPLVDKQLGGTVIYEEYKGDFEAARQTAEDGLKRARTQEHKDEILANALLARGIVHLLQGEPSAALKYFQELEQTFPYDTERRLRALAYAHLATSWQYNLFPDRGGACSAELNLRWNGMDELHSDELRFKPIFEKVANSQLYFECSLVHDFLFSLQQIRSVCSSRVSKDPQEDEILLKGGLQVPGKFLEIAQKQNAPVSFFAYASLTSADLCWRKRNAQLAKHFVSDAFRIFTQSQDYAGLAACNMMWGDWFAAPFSSPLVWNFAIEESSTGESQLSWTLEKEEFSHSISDISQAQVAYSYAEDFYKKAIAPRGLANIQLRLGYIAILQKNYEEAIMYIQKAQDLFKQSGDCLGYRLAQTHRILSRVAACQYPEEQLVAEEIGKWGASDGSFSYSLGLGLLIGRAGRHLLVREGDYERALACFRLASALFRALGVPINLAGSLIDQATVYGILGDCATNIAFSEEAMDLYEAEFKKRPASTPRVSIQSMMLGNRLFSAYIDEMNPTGLERTAMRLKDIVKRAKEQNSTWNMAGLTSPSPQFNAYANASSDGFDSAMVNLAIIGAEDSVVKAQVLVPDYKARKAKDEGADSQAEVFFEEALRQARNATDESNRNFLEAVVLCHKKAYSKALEAYLRYMKESGFSSNDQLVELMKRFGDSGQAEILRDQQNQIDAAFRFMVRIEAYEQAKTYLNQLVGLAGKDWPLRNERPWEALSDWAETYEGLGELDNALTYYSKAMGEFEARRAQLSSDESKTALAGSISIQYLYFQAARTAFKLRQTAVSRGNVVQINSFAQKAFEYSERGRARALLDLMASNFVLTGALGSESNAMREWRQLNAQLTTWRSLIARERSEQTPNAQRITDLAQKASSLEIKLRQAESKLSSSNPNFYRAINPQAETASLSQISSLLPIGTALIQYYFLGEDLLAWAITQQGMVQTNHIQIDVASLNRKIKKYHQACETQDNIDTLGKELAEIFLEPLAKTIRVNPTIILTPYGASHILPFHALPWEGQPLGTSHAISYLPNASAFRYLTDGSTSELPSKILTVGNPANMSFQNPLSGEKLTCDPLFAAGIEASYVASLFPKGRSLVDEEATEELVRELSPQYPLLHFATHGHLSEEAPLLSAILLANGDEMTVYELMGMKLKANLVVLSACQTGQGTTTGGGDVLGLTRGLLGAGARAAVVSLWSVNDLSTSLLMGEFYRQLINGKPGAIALQAAQNYLRTLSSKQIEAEISKLRNTEFSRSVKGSGALAAANDYSHPHYWAPFIFVG